MKFTLALRTRLVALFLVLGLVPLGTYALLSLKHSGEALVHTSGEAMEAVANQAMKALENHFNERYYDVQAFASTTHLEPERLGILPRGMDTFTSQYLIYDLMLVLDANGQVLAANTKDEQGRPIPTDVMLGRDLADKDYFQACITGKVPTGQSFVSALSTWPELRDARGIDPLCIVFACPTTTAEGAINGVWVNFASWQRITGAYLEGVTADFHARGKPSFEINLLGADGTVLHDSDPARVLKDNLRQAGLQAAIELQKGTDGFIIETHPTTGEPQINGFAVSKGTDGNKRFEWGMLARMDVAEANAGIAEQRRWSLTLILVFGAVLLGVAWLTGRSISKPVVRMADVLDRVAEGRLDEQLTVGRADELGRMATSLNRTISVLRQAEGLRLADESRQQEMLRVKAMVENATLAMLHVDAHNRIQYSNPAAVTLLEHLAGIDGARLQNGDLARVLPMGAELQRRGDGSTPLPWTGILPAGEARLSFTLDVIRGADGARQGLCIFFEDVTERLAREEQVRLAAEREHAEAAALQAKVDTLLTTVSAAATGDLTCEVPDAGDDAIGQVGRALNGFFHSLRGSITTIGGNLGQLQDSSTLLGRISGEMTESAEATSSKAVEVANTTTQISGNMQTSASGAEEMGASIREIGRNTAEAARVAASAVTLARSTGKAMNELNHSSMEIGEVVKLISGIAEQTNLLALNATIEAARAGDAGKGFAVVANEVKELAKESAKATESIGRKISTIQENTGHAVDAIAQITTIINTINDLQNSIAGAVEEQSVTTSEITRSVHEAATGSHAIVESMGRLGEVAAASSRGASSTAEAVDHLNRIAEELGGMVGRFRV